MLLRMAELGGLKFLSDFIAAFNLSIRSALRSYVG